MLHAHGGVLEVGQPAGCGCGVGRARHAVVSLDSEVSFADLGVAAAVV